MKSIASILKKAALFTFSVKNFGRARGVRCRRTRQSNSGNPIGEERSPADGASQPSENLPGNVNKAKKAASIAAALLLITLLVIGFWPRNQEVITTYVTSAPLIVTVEEEGKTKVRNRYLITPPIDGFLQRVKLRAGAKVGADTTILATIEAKPSNFLDPRRKQEAEAEEKAALAKRKQMEAELVKREIEYDIAKKEFERIDSLRRKEYVTEKRWDETHGEMKVASEAVKTATFSLEIAAYEHKRALATLDLLKSSGEKSISLDLTSPIDGYILKVFEENARIVTAGTPIMEVGDLNDLEVEVNLLSSDALQVQPNAEVSLKKWGGEKSLKGRVSLVEPYGFTKVSSLGVEEQRVKVLIDFVDPIPPQYKLGDGYRVEARIETWKGDDILQIPTAALFRRGNDWMAFTVDKGYARQKKVEIGRDNALRAEVLSGLQTGDEIILYPPDTLTDGDPITPIPEEH